MSKKWLGAFGQRRGKRLRLPMTTLAIETSTGVGSVVLIQDGVVLFSESFPAERTLSSHLFSVLQRAVAEVEKVEQIIVGLGPGSYAGVRIAISAAIGFALATGAKLLGMPSIVGFEGGEYLAIGDARRESFYFSKVCEGECQQGPLLLEREAFEEALRSHAEMPIISSSPIIGLPQVRVLFPSAERLAKLAEEGKAIISREDLEPIYLREPHITKPKVL
jgi:tRNA threonylcarbamoyladenosine biosynthesis protein TsaB